MERHSSTGEVYRSDGAIASQNSPARISVFTSDRDLLGKEFRLVDGKIEKKSNATFYQGRADVIDAPNAAALQEILDKFTPRQALTTGTITGKASTRISTSSNQIEGTFTRSKAYFEFVEQAGWLLWDYDDKAMPEHVRKRIAHLGGPLEALFYIWPEARSGEYLIRASSSGGVSAPGLPATKNAGLHGFFLIEDVSQSRAILDTLMERAWAAGLGWIMLDVRGQMLKRGLIDVAVGTPERLIFEAPPVLHAPVTRQVPPPHINRGTALPAPTNDADVKARAVAAWCTAAADHQPESDIAKEKYIDEKATEQTRLNHRPYAENRERITRIVEQSDGGLLDDDQYIQFPDASWHRVGDILDHAEQYDRQALPDPIEGISGGRDKAYLLTLPRPGKPNDKPTLVSHIHGGKVVFRFTRYHSTTGAPQLPTAAPLTDGRRPALIKALEDATGADVLPVAVAVLHRMEWSIPVVYSQADVLALIEEHAGDKLREAEKNALRDRLTWLQDNRRKAVLSRTALDRRVTKHHARIEVASLDEIDITKLRGVILVKAPMGSGKTQNIGRPFIDAARRNGGTVMAIAHRISLIAELAARLGLPNYQIVTEGGIEDAGGVAVCLPSTARNDIREAMPTVEYVFVDEIAQVLRFLADKNTCSAGEADNKAVYNRLMQIVRDARAVVVADADLDMRTLRFLEKARPDERFTIVEMPAKPNGKTATVYHKMAAVYDDLTIELEAGGKVWCACEGEQRAAQMARQFEQRGFKAICITAKTKNDPAAVAFLKNAEEQSRLYDLVVSSPAISSGLSIEHKGDPHFTLGAFLGAGTAIRPEDARQQLARVRYLTRYAIAIERTNLKGGQTTEGHKQGAEGAAALEGLDIRWTGFDEYVAGIKAEDDNAKADFGAGMWFGMEASGWTLEHGNSEGRTAAEKELKNARQDYTESRIAALISAEPMTKDLADMARKMTNRSSETETRLEAHHIRLSLGKLDLTEEDIVFWSNGRGLEAIARFEDLIGADINLAEERGTLMQRRYRKARRKLAREMFTGFDLDQVFTRDDQDVLLDRIMADPAVFATTGIVGPKYRARYRGGDGAVLPIKRPQHPAREVRDLFDRWGLWTVRKRARSVPKQDSLVNKKDGLGTHKDREYIICVVPESLEYMRGVLARRAVFDIDRALAERECAAEPQTTTSIAPSDLPTEATVVPHAELHWQKAMKAALMENRRHMAKARQRRIGGYGLRGYGTGTYGAEPKHHIEPVLRQQRRLIVLPELDQLDVMYSLNKPLSRYVVDDDAIRKTWCAVIAKAVHEVFEAYQNLSPTDPEAWQ